MTYDAAVRFLYSLGNEIKTMKLGLGAIHRVCAALGHPERAYRIVHVAGTNGKGSVCAMIEAGLREAGVRTGMFSSPHLIEPTERIQVDGRPISPAAFACACEAVHRAATDPATGLDTHPTYFETITAMAFWAMREAGVETAVIETGLGGRLDCTNIVHPAVTVITHVDFDHMNVLGKTLPSIAAEKAGILKPAAPAIFARQHPEAMEVLDRRARELGIPARATAACEIRDLELDAHGSRFTLFDPTSSTTFEIRCPLAGEHQVDNTATAALALDTLDVSPAGIAETSWPGRLEVVAPNPDVLLDGAHNPAGARTLAAYLRRFHVGHRKIWMIFGVMADKAVDEMARVLFPLAGELIFTAPNYGRAMEPAGLVRIAGRGRAEPNAKAALDWTLDHVSPEDLIVVTGSLYLVGEMRGLFLHTTGGRW